MSKAKIFALILIITGVVSIVYSTFHYFMSLRPNAGLKVTTTPPTEIYLNNKLIGSSPLDRYFTPGEATLKLGTYETKITLYPTVYTVINRDFGSTSELDSGETITLQPTTAQAPTFSLVTSQPDSATILVDDQPVGLSPIASSPLALGSHKFSLSAPGYTTREFTAQALAGYTLVIVAKLSGTTPSITPPPIPSDILVSLPPIASPQPSAQAGSSTLVKILSTPTGFLRLRQGPTQTAAEIGQVQPDSTYPLLQELPDWFEIQVDLPATSSGWISSQYAIKIAN